VDLTVKEDGFSEREPGEGLYGDRRCALRENRLFGADQLDPKLGLGMALSSVFLGMHRSDNH
jgi:hypothetical protein